MRLVLDTSILVASVRSERGASRFLIESALRRRFDLLLSVSLVLEYESVVLRREHLDAAGITASEVETLLIALLGVGLPQQVEPYFGPISLDPEDHHVLSLAAQAEADGIVTHNIRHFAAPARELGVRLYSPAEAAVLLRSLDARYDAD